MLGGQQLQYRQGRIDIQHNNVIPSLDFSNWGLVSKARAVVLLPSACRIVESAKGRRRPLRPLCQQIISIVQRHAATPKHNTINALDMKMPAQAATPFQLPAARCDNLITVLSPLTPKGMPCIRPPLAKNSALCLSISDCSCALVLRLWPALLLLRRISAKSSRDILATALPSHQIAFDCVHSGISPLTAGREITLLSDSLHKFKLTARRATFQAFHFDEQAMKTVSCDRQH